MPADMIQTGDGHIFPDAQLHQQSLLFSVFCNKRDAMSYRVAGTADIDLFSVQIQLTRAFVSSKNRPCHLCSSGAYQTAEAKDFTFMKLKADILNLII